MKAPIAVTVLAAVLLLGSSCGGDRKPSQAEIDTAVAKALATTTTVTTEAPTTTTEAPITTTEAPTTTSAPKPTTTTTRPKPTTTTARPVTTTTMPTTTTAMPTTTTTAPKAWVAVASLSGTAKKAGTPLHLNGGQQRITWKCQGTGGGGCSFYVNKVDGSSGGWYTFPDHNAADTSQAYLAAGDYYLEVGVVGSWTATMSLEELR
jgi:hypothetical protein